MVDCGRFQRGIVDYNLSYHRGTSHNTQSTSGASFQQNIGSAMLLRDAFYFDANGIIYIKSGQPNEYTYEHHTSVGTTEGSVPDDVVDDMVGNTLSHTTGLSSL